MLGQSTEIISSTQHPLPVPEILAPAGGPEQFMAALNSGADAVYLGLKDFNARARATNFTIEDLRQLVPLATRFGMKILVTLNVLIKEEELPKLIEVLAELESLGVYAIIVQDLAIARIVNKHFPRLRLHASTQMAIHNIAGVRQAIEWGFKRVVLARELTAQEVRKIREAFTRSQIEIETFCHGSLCYSYSGLCFFSGANDARSGNRGECAYTCRQPYKILNEPGHGFLFSMRDLDTSNELKSLIEAGVDALKIEGRKKDAQYVSSVVKLYRRKLDDYFGRSTLRKLAPTTIIPSAEVIRADMALSFQRRPTSFFLKGRYVENVIDLDNPTHLGVRVGEIQSIYKNLISIKAETNLEKFDGLKIVTEAKSYHATPQNGPVVSSSNEKMQKVYDNEVAQFSLREFAVNRRKVFVSNANDHVEIEVPDDCRPKVGDIVYKVRSADLKRRTTELVKAPADTRLRGLIDVDLEARFSPCDDGRLAIELKVEKHDVNLAEVTEFFDRTEKRKAGSLREDIESVFGIFGDDGFALGKLNLVGEANYFVPQSLLKRLKRELSADLNQSYESFIDRKIANARNDISVAKHELVKPSKRVFAVKIDRLEYLRHIAKYLETNLQFSLDEVVFEPKRAFLQSSDGEALAVEIMQFCQQTGVAIRFAMPTVIRLWDEPLLKRWIAALKSKEMNRFEVGNIGALTLLKSWNAIDENSDVASDFSLYALNTEASKFWGEAGVSKAALSIEDDFENLRAHLSAFQSSARPQAILFNDTPLFIAEACSLTALHNGCPTAKVCGYRTLEIENMAGEKFFVAHESCKSIVYADDAYAVTDRQEKLMGLGISDFRMDFLTRQYSEAQLFAVLDAAWNQTALAKTHRANFDRTLL